MIEKMFPRFEVNGQARVDTSDTLNDRLSDKVHGRAVVYPVLSGKSCIVSGRGNHCFSQVGSIPDSVEEVCQECFYQCKSLFRIKFGEPSSLKHHHSQCKTQNSKEIPSRKKSNELLKKWSCCNRVVQILNTR